MAKGSQLKQLKAALNQAGVSRQSLSKKKRKQSQASSREFDKVKKAKKLAEIQEKISPFEVKITKVKHDVGGRKLKGVVGRPEKSKQAGIEQRNKTLLSEYESKNRSGGVIDRRFGENDPTMTPDERMLERFTKEMQRASRGTSFNLEDDVELTHFGQSLSKLDDFDDNGLADERTDDEEEGRIDPQTVKKSHFGGFESDDDDNDAESQRTKSKAEVMAEVIAKSKQYKFQRQLERQQDDNTRNELDQEFVNIRELLFTQHGPAQTDPLRDSKDTDIDYDHQVHELAMDRKAKPKNRSKTEEELALEAKTALEKAERKRLRRMVGDDVDSGEDDVVGGRRKRGRTAVGGDRLDDDFFDEDRADIGFGLEGVGDEGSRENFASGMNAEEDSSEGVQDDEDEEALGSGSNSNSGEEEENASDNLGSDEDGDQRKEDSSVRPGRPSDTLPFTFACPESLDALLDIVENVRANDVPTVVQRIRALYHPSLAKGNKEKLQRFNSVLLDYILHITAPPLPRFGILNSLLPQLHALTILGPVESAEHYISKLKLMSKNLTRGLAHGANAEDAKTWPGPSESALLYVVCRIWPSSDMNHAVISPARLLMGAYLGLCRIRCLPDIYSGAFVCTLFLRFEESSKRFVPETINFLLTAILHLSWHPYKRPRLVPGCFPCPDLNSCRFLRISKSVSRNRVAKRPTVVALLDATLVPRSSAAGVEEQKLDALAITLKLLGRFAEMYKGLEGFVEVFEPVSEILEHIKMADVVDISGLVSSTKDIINRSLKFAGQSRHPLALQDHKPVPIASYVPKFDNASSSYLRKNDPDHERAASSKLRYQHKQERKGAIRELRKDARFLSVVKQKEQAEKDRSYTDRMNRVFNALESERAEQKRIERDKEREKKRAGQK